MNKNTNPRRSRPRNNPGRGGGRGNNNKRHHNRGGNRNNHRDGQALDGRSRHNYQQNLDKFLGQAKDAAMSGDPVAAENFYQHAEHYFRVLREDDELKNKKNEARNKPDEQKQPQSDEGASKVVPVEAPVKPAAESKAPDSNVPETKAPESKAPKSKAPAKKPAKEAEASAEEKDEPEAISA